MIKVEKRRLRTAAFLLKFVARLCQKIDDLPLLTIRQAIALRAKFIAMVVKQVLQQSPPKGRKMKTRYKQLLLPLLLAIFCLHAVIASRLFLYAQSASEAEPATKILLPMITNGIATIEQTPLPRRLAYQVGSTYTYDWELTLQTHSSSQDSQGIQTGGNTAQLRGLVDLMILALTAEGEYQLALAVRNPQLVASQHDLAAPAVDEPALTTALATPLLFTQAATGEIRALRFAQDVPAAVTEIQKGIVNILQVSLQGGEQYTVEEEGTQGRYRSHYLVSDGTDGRHVTKTVTQDDFIEMVLTGNQAIQINLQNRIDMHFDNAQGILQTVQVVEELATGDSQSIVPTAEAETAVPTVAIKVRTEGWLRLRQVQTTDNTPLLAASATYIQGSLRANLSAPAKETEEFDLSPFAVEGELQAFVQNPTDAHQAQRIAQMIQSDESQQIVHTIALWLQESSNEQQRSGYVDLLRMAATPAAQQVIIEQVLANDASSAQLKARALTQLADISIPTEQLVERVMALSHHTDLELRNLALLTLGALAHTLDSSDASTASRIGAELTTRLEQATSSEDRELLLLAIGNAGLATTAAVITPYLTDSDPHLRGAATLALRKLPASSVDTQLVNQLYQETNSTVQEMAAVALAYRLSVPSLRTTTAETALQSYAAVMAAAVDGVWSKSWAKSFETGPLKINLPGNITIKSTPDAPALTLNANQSATGRVMGIDFSLFRAQLLSDAPSGVRRFGAYFWLGSNTLVWSHEQTVACNFTKNGVLWEGNKEFFRFSTGIAVVTGLDVTLTANASGYAKITYQYQQQLCDPNTATITGSITPQAAITAQGSAYLSLVLVRGGVTLTADILKSSLPAQISASLTPNGATPTLKVCVDVKAIVEPLSGKLTARADRRKYILFGSWKSLGSWDIWKFAVNSQTYTLLADCVPPTTPCFPEYPTLNAIIGTSGNDPALNGSAAADRICGFTGNDVLYGNAGNDVLAGNEGQDTLYGGPGNDNVGGGKDNDTVSGDDGNDTVTGGLGDDTVYGNKGNDTVYGGEGNDIVGGGEDDDTIYGETGNDQLYGGKGNDNLWGGAGNDVFHYTAGHGNDTIRDFEWSVDSIRLYEVTFRNTTQLGADCQLNLSSGATLRLVNVGTCRMPTITGQ